MTGVDNLRQAISHGTQKLHVSHIDFVMTHREGILTLNCLKIRMLLKYWIIWNLEVGAQLAKGCQSLRYAIYTRCIYL